MNRLSLPLVLTFIVLLAPGCGPQPPPQMAVLGLPIVNGQPDPSAEHMAVVYILSGGYMCTGTLISRDVVLTAGHCVDSSALSSYTIGLTAGSIRNPQATFGVSERLRHPQYDAQYVLNDIALLRLDATAPAGIQPIPFLPAHLSVGADDVGGPIEFVGFGLDEGGSAGRKLHFVGQVKWICEGPDYCQHAVGVYGMPHTLCFDQDLGGTCEGDSGGPALIERAGRQYVAAVTSYGDPDGCSQYGCSTKVDAFEEFITGFTGGGLGSTCTSGDDCYFGHCVEGVCCDAACDTACMSCAEPGRLGHCVVASNGASCSDGDVCNGEEICLMGECVAGTSLECADSDPCTRDACNPVSGCQFDLEPDGFACGDCMMCVSGECVAADCSPGGCTTPGRGAERPWGGWLALIGFGLLGWAIRRGV